MSCHFKELHQFRHNIVVKGCFHYPKARKNYRIKLISFTTMLGSPYNNNTNNNNSNDRLESILLEQQSLELELENLNTAQDARTRANQILSFITHSYDLSDPLMQPENFWVHGQPFICGCAEWDEFWDELEKWAELQEELAREYGNKLNTFIEQNIVKDANQRHKVIQLIQQTQKGNIAYNILSEYEVQIAICGYYEITLVIYGLISISIADDYCSKASLTAVQWFLFVVFGSLGIIAQIQS
eukprot:561785_1